MNDSNVKLKLLIGNKLDLINERNIDCNEAKTYAHERGFIYYETSAKNGTNINDCFQYFTEIFVEANESQIIQFNEIKRKSNKNHCIIL